MFKSKIKKRFKSIIEYNNELWRDTRFCLPKNQFVLYDEREFRPEQEWREEWIKKICKHEA